MMRVEFTANGWEDYCYWSDHDAEKAERIRELIRDIKRDPFKGLGKPEPLKHELAGYWSRRIDGEHRLVYRVQGTGKERWLTVLMCRYHYDP